MRILNTDYKRQANTTTDHLPEKNLESPSLTRLPRKTSSGDAGSSYAGSVIPSLERLKFPWQTTNVPPRHSNARKTTPMSWISRVFCPALDMSPTFLRNPKTGRISVMKVWASAALQCQTAWHPAHSAEKCFLILTYLLCGLTLSRYFMRCHKCI